MAEKICFTPAVELASRIHTGSLSPGTVVDAFLHRIERVDPEINAYVTVLDERARKRAREAEAALQAGGR
jgi:Asp-tRNA(Asn)/Glu-tRNA(Gln) amidotransferase A subunit family amidase